MSESFTRNDLATALARQMNCPVESARSYVEHTLSLMQDALKSGKKVEFRGFGMLEVIRRNPKIGRNPKRPQDGACTIPARNVVKFRAGNSLDAALNSVADRAGSAKRAAADVI